MFVDLKNLAPLVKRQFPSFYAEEADNFLQFIKAYYEWMDEQGAEHKKRRLGEYRDIDETLDEYLDYFMKKYMHGIPKNILSDKRLLEKHILDIYRSKGSSEGLKLLFRLLYDKDIEIYVPQVDMLRTSDGKWSERNYIEVISKNSSTHFSYLNKFITGSTSKAIAFVDDAIEFSIGNQVVNVLYISDIQLGPTGSTFMIGEKLLHDDLVIDDASMILGSACGAFVDSSGPENAIGDLLETTHGSGKNLKFNVKSLLNSDLSKGFISFKIVNGGNGYLANSNISISYKTATTGSGASFRIGSIKDTVQIQYNDNMLSGAVSTALNSLDYGADLNNAFIDTILEDALRFVPLEVGTIASLTGATSGDRLYDGSLQATVTEPRIIGYGFLDENGKTWGNNAVISAELSAANGTVSEVKLLSSGYGFNTQDESVIFLNTSNTNIEVVLKINVCGVGKEEGTWLDQSGFLNSDKYLQDSYYYQEYSYEIQVEKSLDKYVDVVKQVMHPVGNRMFGKPLIIDVSGAELTLQTDSLSSNINLQVSNTIYDYFYENESKVYIYMEPDEPSVWRYTSNGSILNI